jgi:hypothetical protein
VEIIGNSAFNGNQITNIVIGNSVESIGNWAFANNLLTTIIIPSSLIILGVNAFSGNQFTSITINSNAITSVSRGTHNLSYIFGIRNVTDRDIELIIGDNVITIAAEVFNNGSLTSIVFGNSLTIIGQTSFRNNRLTSIVMSSSVTTIGNAAFSDNPTLDVVRFTGNQDRWNTINMIAGFINVFPSNPNIIFNYVITGFNSHLNIVQYVLPMLKLNHFE